MVTHHLQALRNVFECIAHVATQVDYLLVVVP